LHVADLLDLSKQT